MALEAHSKEHPVQWQRIPPKGNPQGNPYACKLPSELETAYSWLVLNTHLMWVPWTWRVHLAVRLTCCRIPEGEQSSHSTVHELEQPGRRWSRSPAGCQVLIWKKRRKRKVRTAESSKTTKIIQSNHHHHSRSCRTPWHPDSGIWLNVCRHRHVMEMLICVSLRAMENIQPASTLSLYTDLFYLLRVSHSSGVHRRVNLIYCEVPHSGMKCFIHRQD